MTTAMATASNPTAAIPTVQPEVTNRQLWSSFMAAEWVKLRTVRSTVITLIVAAVFAVGFGWIACDRFAQHVSEFHNAAQRADFLDGFDAASQSLVGNAVAQLAIGALGVVVVTGEFATGMIRATLGAMPQRQRWIAAKLAVFAIVALVMGQLLTFASFGIGQATLAGQHVGMSLGDPGALRAVVATGIYVSLVGLMGAAFGLLIRHTAGALSALLGVLFVLPALANGLLSDPLRGQVARLLPENIGGQAASARLLDGRLLGPWTGIGVMAGYVVALLVIGCVLLHRRDA